MQHGVIGSFLKRECSVYEKGFFLFCQYYKQVNYFKCFVKAKELIYSENDVYLM